MIVYGCGVGRCLSCVLLWQSFGWVVVSGVLFLSVVLGGGFVCGCVGVARIWVG